MDNPLKLAREAQNLTQEELAALATVGVQTIKKLEWGLFTSINPEVLTVLTAGTNKSRGGLTNEYEDWILSKRQEQLIPTRRNLDDCRGGWISWLEFRTMFSDSQVGFCKLFCVTPQVLQTWEAGFDKGFDRSSWTPYLRQLWEDVGLTDEEIVELQELVCHA